STQSLVGFAREIRRHCGASGGAERRLPVQRDWLAVEAVSSEPVSGLNSLVTGRFTGNFAPREPSCPDQTTRKCLPIGPFSAFGSCPVQNRAGNFRTGIRELSGVIREFIALSREPPGCLALHSQIRAD